MEPAVAGGAAPDILVVSARNGYDEAGRRSANEASPSHRALTQYDILRLTEWAEKTPQSTSGGHMQPQRPVLDALPSPSDQRVH